LPLDKTVFNALPEEVRGLYKDDGQGNYSLNAAPKADLHRFIEQDRVRTSEVEAFKKRYEGVDPEAARKALEAQKAADQKRAVDAGEFESLLNKTRAEKDAEAAKLKAEYEAKLGGANSTLERLLRDDAVTKAALAAGVQTEFIEDVALHAAGAFKVVDGVLAPVGHEYKTVDGWLKNKLSSKKGWLGPSVGGGTQPKTGSIDAGRKFSDLNAKEKGELFVALGPTEFAKRAKQK
jgi:hypothetical protein